MEARTFDSFDHACVFAQASADKTTDKSKCKEGDPLTSSIELRTGPLMVKKVELVN